MCQAAILGIATIRISDAGDQLVLRKFNPTREIQHDLVRKISKALEKGENRASSNPLVIAIDQNNIDTSVLADSYDIVRKSPALTAASITNPKTPLFVLAGFHRVSAARSAIKSLGDRLEKLKVSLEKIKSPHAHGRNEGGDDPSQAHQASLTSTIMSEIETLESLLEAAQVWPVWFYDFGWSRSLCNARKNY